MKTLVNAVFIFLVATQFALRANGQSVYTQSIRDINDQEVTLSICQGKKTMFIIAPVEQADSLKLDAIAAFNNRYGDTIKLIGIISKEHGYVDSNKARIKAMYQSKGINMLLTQAMFTKKEAGANQSALLKWLTVKSLNKRFGEEVLGIGQKFFVDENGKLYAVLIPQTDLFSPAVERNIYRNL